MTALAYAYDPDDGATRMSTTRRAALKLAYDAGRDHFLQTDPVGYEDDLNLYVYVRNDPLNNSDPTGRFCESRATCDMRRDDEQLARREITITQHNDRAAARAEGAVTAATALSPVPGDEAAVAAAVGGRAIVSRAAGAADEVAEAGAAAAGSLDDMSRAAGAPDRNGLTAAGRAIQKHGDREGSAFPQVTGGPRNLNPAGQNAVDDILTTPGATQTPNRFGGVDVVAPDGRGVRYNASGEMMGLLEP